MQWLNEPASWQRAGDEIKVNADPGTDFWRETGYGYIHDSGHVYGEVLPGDLDVSVRLRPSFATQYDQAGIMLRLDERTWLKAGLEHFDGRPRLSTVLTLGQSSWVVSDLPDGLDEITLLASRRGDAVEVRYSADGGSSELAALVYLPPGRDVLAGVMCAAPDGPGFGVTFRDLRIAGREWAAVAGAAGAGDGTGVPGNLGGGDDGSGATREASDWADRADQREADRWVGRADELEAAAWAGESAGVWHEPGPGWAEPAATWEEPAVGPAGTMAGRPEAGGEWAEPAAEWTEPAAEWAEPAAEWAEPAAEWTEPAAEWTEPAAGWTGAAEPAAGPAGAVGGRPEAGGEWAEPGTPADTDWGRLSAGPKTTVGVPPAVPAPAEPADETGPMAVRVAQELAWPTAGARTGKAAGPLEEAAVGATAGAPEAHHDGEPAAPAGPEGSGAQTGPATAPDLTDPDLAAVPAGSSAQPQQPSQASPVPPPAPPPPAPPPPARGRLGSMRRRLRRRADPSPVDPAEEWLSMLTGEAGEAEKE